MNNFLIIIQWKRTGFFDWKHKFVALSRRFKIKHFSHQLFSTNMKKKINSGQFNRNLCNILFMWFFDMWKNQYFSHWFFLYSFVHFSEFCRIFMLEDLRMTQQNNHFKSMLNRKENHLYRKKKVSVIFLFSTISKSNTEVYQVEKNKEYIERDVINGQVQGTSLS